MPNITLPTLRELMAAGAHFGHKRERSHPKAKSYVYVLREGIFIIDLAKTLEGLEKALAYLTDLASHGKTVLFVGTKPQAADLVKAAAMLAGMPYIVHHWPGGLLTNFETVAANLKQLSVLEARLADETNPLNKKERSVIGDKVAKTVATLGGVREMKRLPDALFVVDVVAESTAVTEAHRLAIPVVAICDTNANPTLIEYPIPANDDARKTIGLITELVGQAIAANKAAAPVAEASQPATPAVETVQKGEPNATLADEKVIEPALTEETDDQPAKVDEAMTAVAAAEVADQPAKTSKAKTASAKPAKAKPATKAAAKSTAKSAPKTKTSKTAAKSKPAKEA